MKKTDGLIALGAIGFGVLFYDHAPGINFLLFSIMYGILSVFTHSNILRSKWYLFYAIHVLTAINILVIHSDLALWAWSLSLLVVVGKTYQVNSSILLTKYFGIASSVMVFEKIPYLNYQKVVDENKTKSPLTAKYLLASAIVLVILVIFLLLYRSANPLFQEFTDKIDFSWFNFPFILFCLLGSWVLYAMIYPYVEDATCEWDSKKHAETIDYESTKISVETRKLFAFVAILIFLGLNAMLLVLNVLDINSIFVQEKLPENIFLSDFLHFAVWSIVFSTLLAIVIIVSLQQFSIENKLVRFVIYAWISQSLLMVFNTFIRNYWYSFNQITYLRIAVFVFLLICIIGLIYTAYVVKFKRNYWFLMNSNLQIWFFIIVVLSFFSWDRIITKHNLAFEKKSEIDFFYLTELSYKNLDLLYEFKEENPEVFKKYGNRYYPEKIDNKIKEFQERVKKHTWQSYNLPETKLKKHFRFLEFKNE
jgi:hypothetical protein